MGRETRETLCERQKEKKEEVEGCCILVIAKTTAQEQTEGWRESMREVETKGEKGGAVHSRIPAQVKYPSAETDQKILI